jgi:hypothetical protein
MPQSLVATSGCHSCVPVYVCATVMCCRRDPALNSDVMDFFACYSVDGALVHCAWITALPNHFMTPILTVFNKTEPGTPARLWCIRSCTMALVCLHATVSDINLSPHRDVCTCSGFSVLRIWVMDTVRHIVVSNMLVFAVRVYDEVCVAAMPAGEGRKDF